ncbi:unnamed protein product [Phytomonas sp. EM1]|nr:unnamed protein product [Phytomonas sp. EM1]|eukprot:CCW60682.1 unnamed protein product [Phytomonas sp. isolate EM1]
MAKKRGGKGGYFYRERCGITRDLELPSFSGFALQFFPTPFRTLPVDPSKLHSFLFLY